MFLFQSTDDIDKYAKGLGSFRNKYGYGSNLKTNPRELHDHEDDTLRPTDLLTFAWQIAQAMVEDAFGVLNLYCEDNRDRKSVV